MTADQDFMVMRRAALMIDKTERATPALRAVGALLSTASARPVDFIRLRKAGVQSELIDLAWAVIGEERPGGPAVAESEVMQG